MMMGGKGVGGGPFTYGVNGQVSTVSKTSAASTWTMFYAEDDTLINYHDVLVGVLYTESSHSTANFPVSTTLLINNLAVGTKYVSVFYKKLIESSSSYSISDMTAADGGVLCAVILRNTDWSALNPTTFEDTVGTTDGNSPVDTPDASPSQVTASNGFSVSIHVIDTSVQWTGGSYYGGWTDGQASVEVNTGTAWLTASIGVKLSQTMGDTPSSYDSGSYGTVAMAWQYALSVGDW